MKPTDVLKDEHRVIERVLSCLESIAAAGARAGRLEVADAREALEFLRGFADQCHHGKEEAELFPMLEARGFSPEAGPTAVMKAEHVQGRAHVAAMTEAIEAVASGRPDAMGVFAQHAAGYVALLREHIQKEDHCLFAMADQVLSAGDQRALMERFEHVEHAEVGEGTHERMLAIAERLSRKYGVEWTSVAGSPENPGAAGRTCSPCHHGA